MTQINDLKHNGVLILDIPYLELTIEIKGKPFKLNPEQEQMAIAWVRKLSTPYVEDPIFCENFFKDFSEVLGFDNLTDDDIDFTNVIDYIEDERLKRESLTKEEKKEAREMRKIERERLKEIYGTAILNGEIVEISNYTAEPSSIFMGRGEHPMRGKWKKGPTKEDIILNLSPNAPKPEGNWKEIVWEPECLWIAKWDDKLSGKTKYVWLSDNTPIKQDREIEKFNKSKIVGENLERIRKEIDNGIKNSDKRTQKIALACYIIDRLIMRVGDEKDEDEADTVGATTLRPEHITITDNNVAFNFLGKDSVEWNKEIVFPDHVIKVLRELISEAEESGEEKPQIFSKIGSSQVNDFLGNIVEGLTAKVFRTYHATNTVASQLDEADVNADDAEYKKKEAAVMANREAAIVCNHMKQEPKNWDNRIQKFRERKIKANERIESAKANQIEKEKRLEILKVNLTEKKKQEEEQQEILNVLKEEFKILKETPNNFETEKELEDHKKIVEKLKKKIETQKRKVEAARKRVDSATSQLERGKNSLGTAKERVYKAKDAYKKIESQERIAKNTKVWNLGTSLKSYVDPRVYYDWGKDVDYDWRNYYSRTLQNKFSWVERDDD
ncbi:MAG TPA: DNA topoisomerase I [candidate division Zixibacteria bacterium]|nr:DNA topoisomerase I [candidate division Zixibacteria bacterium]